MTTLVIATGSKDLAYVVSSLLEDPHKYVAYCDTPALGRLPLHHDGRTLPECMHLVAIHFDHSRRVIDALNSQLASALPVNIVPLVRP